jgi:hypothetical protein
MVDILLCLAWVALILAPAILAHYKPVVPKDASIDFTAEDLTEPHLGLPRKMKK